MRHATILIEACNLPKLVNRFSAITEYHFEAIYPEGAAC
jgi:hypothetical protein